jgi:hypothetical protein
MRYLGHKIYLGLAEPCSCVLIVLSWISSLTKETQLKFIVLSWSWKVFKVGVALLGRVDTCGVTQTTHKKHEGFHPGSGPLESVKTLRPGCLVLRMSYTSLYSLGFGCRGRLAASSPIFFPLARCLSW